MNNNSTNSNSLFRKSMTKWVANPLKEYGFKRYKTTNIARISKDSIIQILNFQKEAFGGKTFTVNVAVRPLFVPSEDLSLEPGNRIGYFKYSYDKWWDFNEEVTSNNSFEEINEIIFSAVISWFDKVNDIKGLIKIYEDKEREMLVPTHLGWRYFDLGHLYAKNDQFDEAIYSIKEAKKEFDSRSLDWCKNASKQCEFFINVLNNGSRVEHYLIDSESKTRSNLGLSDW